MPKLNSGQVLLILIIISVSVFLAAKAFDGAAKDRAYEDKQKALLAQYPSHIASTVEKCILCHRTGESMGWVPRWEDIGARYREMGGDKMFSEFKKSIDKGSFEKYYTVLSRNDLGAMTVTVREFSKARCPSTVTRFTEEQSKSLFDWVLALEWKPVSELENQVHYVTKGIPSPISKGSGKSPLMPPPESINAAIRQGYLEKPNLD